MTSEKDSASNAAKHVKQRTHEQIEEQNSEQVTPLPIFGQQSNIDPHRLTAQSILQLQRTIGNRNVNFLLAQAKQNQATKFLIQRVYSKELNQSAYLKGGVRAKLLEGTQDLPESLVLDAIMRNFANIGFTYSMVHAKGEGLLDGRLDGDCRTVVEAFVILAKEIGFDDVKMESKIIEMVVPGQPCIDKNKAPNINRGNHWAFDNHYWAVDGKGGIYDILFTARDINEAAWMLKEQAATKDLSTGLTYEVYGGKTFYSGMVDATPYDMVTLQESELVQIRETYEKLQAKDQKVEPEDEEPEIEMTPLEQIKDRINDFVPGEKLEQTAKKIFVLIGNQMQDGVLSTLLTPILKKICSGSWMDGFTFDQSKWDIWIKT